MMQALAVAAALSSYGAASALASVHISYSVGQLDSLGTGDDLFSASLLHDATASPAGTAPANLADDNRAYRMGATSGFMSGSLYGDYDASSNQLTAIGGTVSGNLRLLFSNDNLNDKNFVLKLGQEAGAGKTGALKFETNGAGTGEYTGGFVDFALAIVGESSDFLTGTFFFKPQAETGSLMLSPNRGTASEFTLWGYNWMHSSGPYGTSDAVSWDSFLEPLGYDGNVTRPSILADELNRTLGVALYVNAPSTAPTSAANPEPTTCVIWGVLVGAALVFTRRSR